MNIPSGITLVLAIWLDTHLTTGVAAELPVVASNQVGLQVGKYDPQEPVAANGEESGLGLKPFPRLSQVKPYYLLAPQKYDRKKPPPLVVVLHERGRLSEFSSKSTFDASHLDTYAKGALSAWKDLAEKEVFLLVLPLGDPDVLWMGMSWFTGDRSKLIAALLETIAKTHAFDRSRIYLVASGEGAHAAIATAVRDEQIAAVAACNPPLFEGKSIQDKTIFPETVDEMLAAAGKQKTPILILAGDKDKELGIRRHTLFGQARDRYEDSSRIPAAHIRQRADQLKAAKFPIEFKTIPVTHFAPLPADQVEPVWAWLKKQQLDPK